MSFEWATAERPSVWWAKLGFHVRQSADDFVSEDMLRDAEVLRSLELPRNDMQRALWSQRSPCKRFGKWPAVHLDVSDKPAEIKSIAPYTVPSLGKRIHNERLCAVPNRKQGTKSCSVTGVPAYEHFTSFFFEWAESNIAEE